jgi:hypothetical protein
MKEHNFIYVDYKDLPKIPYKPYSYRTWIEHGTYKICSNCSAINGHGYIHYTSNGYLYKPNYQLTCGEELTKIIL